jgi:hypothetical protein
MHDKAFEICERVAEAQAILDDHKAGGRYTAAEVVEKLHGLLSEEGCCGPCGRSGTSP